ncbi:MAG: hypothetical protein ACRCY8_02730 [Dermatophilaceae bacterium]
MADLDRRYLLTALALSPAVLVLSGCPATGNEDGEDDGGEDDD